MEIDRAKQVEKQQGGLLDFVVIEIDDADDSQLGQKYQN